MKPIRIDFAPRSFKRVVMQTRALVWLFAGIGLLVSTGAAMTALDLVQKHDALQADRQRTEAQLARRIAFRPEPTKFLVSEAQAGAVNAAIAQLNLPWRDVFDAVEASTPATIALLALEPDAKKHLIRGIAEAKTSEGMIAYIEQLKKQAFFGTVALTRHEINEQDPNQPIRFQFEAHWAEESP